MNKTQTQQIVVIVLLLAFVVTWLMTKGLSPGAKQAPPQGAAAARPSPGKGAEPPPEPKASGSQTLPEPTLARDLFQMPALLKEVIAQRERAREEERRRKETKPTVVSGLPPKEVPPSLPSLQLQGIIWGATPQVIINRKILSVGDTIEEAKIVSVTKEGATLSFQGQEFYLSLKDSGKESSSAGRENP